MKRESNQSAGFGLPEHIDGFAPHALVYSDGFYRLFFGRRSFPYGLSKCALSVSENLLDWSEPKDVIVPGLSELTKIGAGSAINRNGKTAYFYTVKSLFSSEIRMASTPDFVVFERYPLPVIAKKNQPKKSGRAGAPRVFKSGEDYYLAAGSKAGTLLYQSKNLMDWRLRGTLQGGEQTDFVSLVQSGNRHILLETRGKRAAFGYRYGWARPEDGVFTAFHEVKPLDSVVSPRVTTLADGRLILIAGLLRLDGRCDSLALPKEIFAEESGLFLRPARELMQRRRGETVTAFDAGETTATQGGLSGNKQELFLSVSLKNAQSFTVRCLMAGCRGLFITVDREKGEVTFDASTLTNSKKCNPATYTYHAGEKLDLQLVLLPGRAECFLDSGALTFSRGFDAELAGRETGFEAKGNAFCKAVKYELE